MAEPVPDSLRTRVSLLDRVKNLDDARSWEEFFRTYDKLVQGLARRRGLREDEAEEVAQEVFKRVAQTIHQFEHPSRAGSFRNWIGRLTRWRAEDKLRERARQPFESWRNGNDGLPLAEQVPAEIEPEMEFEQEARRHLLETLFRRLETQVPPKHIQLFQLLVIQNMPVSRVAGLYGLSTANVYVIKHRVMQKLRDEMQRLSMQWE